VTFIFDREADMKVKDVMTTKVITIEPKATVLKAARQMLQKRISGLPVVAADGELLGIVTEGDFLRRTELGTRKRRSLWHDILVGPGRLAEEYVHSHGRFVHEVMTPSPRTVTENVDLIDVVDLMEKHAIKRLPVMRKGKLVGLVTRANLMRALAAMPPEPAASTDDSAVRERLMTELKSERWAQLATVEVVVRNGIVHFWGAIMDERDRKALVTAAENIAGVKEVRDHLAWFEPYTGVVIPQESEDDDAARALN
jgi:CBS domain-containing protein